MTKEQEIELREAIEELRKVNAWVSGIVRERHDEWKADAIEKVISLGEKYLTAK